MNKILTLAALLGLSAAVHAQYDRLVLFEEFTQASCGPCASQNPGFNDLLHDNLDKATSIKYQVWWPGYDPMYLHNTADVNARVSYYGVTGVPHATMDGDNVTNDCGYYEGAPACVNQTDIDNEYANSSPFQIELSHVVSGDYSHVDVTMHITAGADVTGDLVAHIVVVERNIFFDTAPGSNGETEFFNVMKKMLPSNTGTALAGSWYAGDEQTITAGWDFVNVYDPSEIAVVAFIQDNSSKEVFQSAFSAPYAVYATDVMNVSTNLTGNASQYLCDGNAGPKVTIKNIGEDDLTSLTIGYTINGESFDDYNWAGSLAYGESAVVSLPASSFTLEDENEIEVTLSNPNGGADGFDGNNVSTGIAFGAPESPANTIHLKIRTDNYASETTWEILNEDGDVLEEGGPYNGQNNQVVFDEDIILPASGCYNFNIYDSYGDGICCAYGSGYYEISDSDGSLLIEGGEFGTEDNAIVKVLDVVGVDEVLAQNWNMFPNPADDHVQITLQGNGTSSVEVLDMTGRLVLPAAFLQAGTHTLNTAALEAGMYQVVLRTDGQVSTRLLTIQ